MSAEELERLKTAWVKAYPRRAQGGAVSLAGFAYQFHVTILAAVEKWLAAPTSASPIA